MTLRRTTTRREKRKRARQRKIERLARWNALSPEEQARRNAFDEMMVTMLLPVIERNLNLRLARVVNRSYPSQPQKLGVVDIRLPERYRTA